MNQCRLCGGHVQTALKLKPTPLANLFPDGPNQGEMYPLELRECEQCAHVQIGHLVPDELLYGAHYAYRTPAAQQPDMVKRAWALKMRYTNAKTVLEIGSNNGLLLEQLRLGGFESVIGMDPCDGSAFTSDAPLADRSIDLIIANNVLAHVWDLHDIFKGIARVLSDDGALVFEVQYFPDLVERGAFDMIYHEHRDYHALGPLHGFLGGYGLGIAHFERIPAHGGSIRVHCTRIAAHGGVVEQSTNWWRFKKNIESAIYGVTTAIDAADTQIIAFGASAKACTLIHQCGIADKIAYAVDNTPEKIGKYIAGTRIRIFDEHILKQSKSEKTLLLTAWNYEPLIRAKYPDLPFIVPFSPRQRLAA